MSGWGRGSGVGFQPKYVPTAVHERKPVEPLEQEQIRHVFLTGYPGCGKTTAVLNSVQLLQNQGMSLQGFYTREVRENERRVGFCTVILPDESTSMLATSRYREPPCIGRYTVDVPSIAQTVVPSLRPTPGIGVYVCDEIGKMELLCAEFEPAVAALLDHPASRVLGTVPMKGPKFVQEVKNRADVRVIEVSDLNRDALPADIVSMLCDELRADGGPSD